MTFNLIGLTDAPTAAALLAAGTLPGHVARPAAGLTAILMPQRRRGFLPGQRHELADLLDIQRAMEAVLPFGPLLPARPGTRFAAAEEAGSLDAAAATLNDAFAASARLHQYQITVRWDPKATLASLAATGALGAVGHGEDLGAMLRSRMADEKIRLGLRIGNALEPIAGDSMHLANLDADVVADIVVLVAPGTDIDPALEAIDAMLVGDSRVRCVGPLPPVSFAAIVIDKVDDDAVSAARRLLGIAGEMTTRGLRQAFVSASRRQHPDMGGAGDLDETKQAYRLLEAVSGHGAGRALVRVVRDGEQARREAA